MATYKHLRSSTANKRPTTSIADGQLAINTNTASPGLFFKDSAGTGIVKVGPVHVGTTAPNSTPAAGGSSGNYLGEQWLDTSVSPAQMKVWNGSAWIGVVADELPVSKLQDGAAGQIVQTDSAGTGVEWSSTANLPLGSAAAPAYRFQGDGDSGVYSPGANQVAISTAGTGRLFVDSSGNVTTANEKLNAIRVGLGAGAVSTNTALGDGALTSNTTGSNNTAVGKNTLYYVIDGTNNTAVGATALQQTTGSNNTGVGSGALYTSSSGSDNVAVGYLSLYYNNSGANNTGIGRYSLVSNTTGNNNIGIGYNAGQSITTGSNNVIIGNIAGTSSLANTIILGDGAGNERLRIDSSGRLLVGTSSDSGGALLQVNGDRIRVGTAKTPASATATGTAGEICWDADYVYVCTATNTWKRTAIATW